MGGLYQRCLRRQRWVQRTHNTAKSEGLMVPPDFIVSLCSKMKTACLHHPVAEAAAGGLEQGLGPFGVCALSAGGSRGEAKIQPPPPQNTQEPPSPSLPPAKNRFSTHPFCRIIIFFHRSSVRSEAISGRGSQRGSRGLLGSGEHPG